MISLTTRQRDILRIMLNANRPIGSAELAALLHITPRQVNYSMKGVKTWLRQHNQDLHTSPGVGFAVALSTQQARALCQEISGQVGVQIVLSASQRQQLLALFLLTATEPFILFQFEQLAQVSRMTLTKDLDEIENWLQDRQIKLIRKPHFGFQVSGAEHRCQQALAQVLWSETPFSADPIIEITHSDGLIFNLQSDAPLSPLVESVDHSLSQIDLHRARRLVAQAEEQLGGRFTDDAVLHLALVFAILASRVRNQLHLQVTESQLNALTQTKVWHTAQFVARQLGRDSNSTWKPGDVAGVAMELLAAPRSEMLSGELEADSAFAALIDRLMEYISQQFEISKLRYDRALHNGLWNSIVPACFRQRFQLWFPMVLNRASLPEEYERESAIAQHVAAMVHDYTDVELPQGELDNLVVLLRAALIRNPSSRFEHVIVLCPSGMATSQLLVARLTIRFPYFKNIKVVSLRDLTPALIASTDLVLTTVPLSKQFANSPKVIQVHPLLVPKDIEAITKFLS